MKLWSGSGRGADVCCSRNSMAIGDVRKDSSMLCISDCIWVRTSASASARACAFASSTARASARTSAIKSCSTLCGGAGARVARGLRRTKYTMTQSRKRTTATGGPRSTSVSSSMRLESHPKAGGTGARGGGGGGAHGRGGGGEGAMMSGRLTTAAGVFRMLTPAPPLTSANQFRIELGGVVSIKLAA